MYYRDTQTLCNCYSISKVQIYLVVVYYYLLQSWCLAPQEDADLDKRVIKSKSDPALYIFTVVLLVSFCALMATGQFPKAKNRTLTFVFLNHNVTIGSLSVASAFLALSVLCSRVSLDKSALV